MGKLPGSGSTEKNGRYVLRLYVSGLTPNPELARADQTVAVPTLVKRLPLPVRRLIGDLSKKERVLVEFDLRERA